MITCRDGIRTLVCHEVGIPPCCPVSGNPRPGSRLRVRYRPRGTVFPVEDLAAWVDAYRGGHPNGVRNMEEMIQDLAVRIAAEVGVPVRVVADLRIDPPFGGDEQTMRVTVSAP